MREDEKRSASGPATVSDRIGHGPARWAQAGWRKV